MKNFALIVLKVSELETVEFGVTHNFRVSGTVYAVFRFYYFVESRVISKRALRSVLGQSSEVRPDF